MELLPQNMSEWMRDVKRDLQELKRHRHPSTDAEVADLENRVANLETQVADLESVVADIESLVSDLETLVTSLEARVDDLETLTSNLETRISDLEDITDALSDPPWRSLVTGNGQTIPHDSWTGLIAWTGVFGDPGDGRISYQNSGQFEVSEAGFYVADAQVSFDAASGGTRGVRLVLNGDIAGIGQEATHAGSINTVHAHFEGFVPADSTITVMVYQSSGGSIDVNSADFLNRFTIHRFAPA